MKNVNTSAKLPVPADYSKASALLEKFASKPCKVKSWFESTEISSTLYYFEKGSIRVFHDPASEYPFITLEWHGDGYSRGSTVYMTSDSDIDYHMADEALNNLRDLLIKSYHNELS